jgi:hypothetical protein
MLCLARQFVANNDNPVYSALHLWSLPALNVALDDLGSAILDHRSDGQAMDLIRDKRPSDILYPGDVDLKELMESIEGAGSTPDDIRTKAELVLSALGNVVIASKEYGGLSIYAGLHDYQGIDEDLLLYAGHECLFLRPEAKPLGTCWREALLAIRQ